MATDVVYALGPGSPWQNNELRYSLRSLEKNFRDLGNIYIVGIYPDFLKRQTTNDQQIFHLPADDPFSHNKDGNIIRKVLLACQREDLSKNFLFMNDDYYINHSISAEEFNAWYISYLTEYREDWFNENNWRASVKRSREYLLSRNFSAFHYDGAHCPQVYNKWTFQKVFNSISWDGELGYTISNIYLNVINARAEYIGDGRKALVESIDLDPEKVKKSWFISNNDIGLTDDFKSLLQELFPEPSKYEKK